MQGDFIKARRVLEIAAKVTVNELNKKQYTIVITPETKEQVLRVDYHFVVTKRLSFDKTSWFNVPEYISVLSNRSLLLEQFFDDEFRFRVWLQKELIKLKESIEECLTEKEERCSI